VQIHPGVAVANVSGCTKGAGNNNNNNNRFV